MIPRHSQPHHGARNYWARAMTPENEAAWMAIVSGTSQLCETCDGEGRIIRRPSGGNVWDEIDCGPCPDCDGTGTELIETERVTLEDIISRPIETFPKPGTCRFCGAPSFYTLGTECRSCMEAVDGRDD